MKYMLLIETDPKAWSGLSDAGRNEVYRGHGAFIDAITVSGEFVSAEALADPSHTAVVRVRDGVREVCGVPFARQEAAHLCGYYIVDCDDGDRAVELAALIPEARFGAVEVRPLMSLDGEDA